MPLRRSKRAITNRVDRSNNVSDSIDEGKENVQEEKGVFASLICETPVTIFQEPKSNADAPKKSVVYVCRLQAPACESVHEKWSLEPYGVQGYWGYVFKYGTGELWLYQRNEGETVEPLSAVGMLSSNDWAVLRLVMPNHSTVIGLSEYTRDQEVAVAAKQPEWRPRPRLSKRSGNREPVPPAAGSYEPLSGHPGREDLRSALSWRVLILTAAYFRH
ncbi:hypothetical protein GBF38_003833 [Nibea albiflora]|uniref:Uncharacterized protein n=1 Tax=Nibea albiflora TaxID=240163 RepID=A0ACB7F1L2_NIBAL|nr:hypothetical protein GBF38_003833 [Nibea albiflora]